MAETKSPFFVIRNFISPKQALEITDTVYEPGEPDKDKDGKPIRMTTYNEQYQAFLYYKIMSLMPSIERYYGFHYKGMETIKFESIQEGSAHTEPQAENAIFKKQWRRVKPRDFTGVIFLSNEADTVETFDEENNECYGGMLEFPQHNFKFNPEVGTLVIFPSGPHFINFNSAIIKGTAYQVRFHIQAQLPYLYTPERFPGNHTVWFDEL